MAFFENAPLQNLSSGIVKPKALYDYLDGQECDMDTVNLADAKAHLSELVDRVEKDLLVDFRCLR